MNYYIITENRLYLDIDIIINNDTSVDTSVDVLQLLVTRHISQKYNDSSPIVWFDNIEPSEMHKEKEMMDKLSGNLDTIQDECWTLTLDCFVAGTIAQTYLRNSGYVDSGVKVINVATSFDSDNKHWNVIFNVAKKSSVSVNSLHEFVNWISPQYKFYKITTLSNGDFYSICECVSPIQ